MGAFLNACFNQAVALAVFTAAELTNAAPPAAANKPGD
jgi:hypothetical protein